MTLWSRWLLVLGIGAVLLSLGAVAFAAPILTPFPEYVAPEGTMYVTSIRLDDWVEDPTAPDEELTWSFPADTALRLALTPDRHLVVRPPNADWQGTETVLLTVCNPAGECTTGAVSFRVENAPDDPIIEWIPDQATGGEAPFAPLDLGPYGWDPDGDSVAWEVGGGAVLTAAIVDGVLSVDAPDGWVGRDAVEIMLRDSTGRSATRSLFYTATESVPVVITSLGGEGIMIQWGGVKILIDALVRDALPLTTSDRRRLQEAVSPYDGVTLALVTHPHYDHFDAGYATQFLLHSPGTRFVSLAETAEALRGQDGWERIADRVIGIPFSAAAQTGLEVDAAVVTAFHLEHTGLGSIPNLAFLIEVGGLRLLHLGDATEDWSAADLVAAFGWPSLCIDVLFASNRWLVTSPDVNLVAAAVAPRFAIPVHFAGSCPASRTAYAVGDAALVLLCAKGSSWIVPPQDGGTP
jgi:L-ascorbate metabolism protein UlaG (beta-lactamase superfamily)